MAAEWMGWENKFHCEWNTFGQKILHHYWPNAEQFTDITKSDFTKYANKIDILTGGFPCQPYSSAGKRLGKEDERHLWPEMLRAIREIQPSWVVGENVRGLTNWNGGLVFDEVQSDLEAEGYEVLPFLLPACAVNAPHRRDRIWFVAHATSNGYKDRREEARGEKRSGEQGWMQQFERMGRQWDAPNSESERSRQQPSENKGWEDRRFNDHGKNGIASNSSEIRLQQCENGEKVGRRQGEVGTEGSKLTNELEANGKIANPTNSSCEGLQGEQNQGKNRGAKSDGTSNRRRDSAGIFCSKWEEFPTQSPVCDGNDGLPKQLDGITFPKWRNESIKAGGNAIVPQVALMIFKAIQEYKNIKL